MKHKNLIGVYAPKQITFTKENSRWNDNAYIVVTNHSFLNCQVFTIGAAYNMIGSSKLTIKKLFKYITTKICAKKQVVIDIKQSQLDDMKKTLKPIYKNFRIKKYISTNGSKMVICFIVLDLKKIKE